MNLIQILKNELFKSIELARKTAMQSAVFGFCAGLFTAWLIWMMVR